MTASTTWTLEAAEAELNRFIDRRSEAAEKNGEQRPEEVMYAESVRRYNAAREAERRAAWSDYHQGQAKRLRRVMTALVAFHEAKAQQLSSETKKGSA